MYLHNAKIKARVYNIISEPLLLQCQNILSQIKPSDKAPKDAILTCLLECIGNLKKHWPNAYKNHKYTTIIEIRLSTIRISFLFKTHYYRFTIPKKTTLPSMNAYSGRGNYIIQKKSLNYKNYPKKQMIALTFAHNGHILFC